MDELINESERIATEEAEQEPVSEQTVAAAQPDIAVGASAFDYESIKKIIDAHYATIVSIVRYNKEKDANVIALSKQMQAYRDGFEATMFKRVALELVSYREDCKKTRDGLTPGCLSVEKVAKYLDYMTQDLEDLMLNIGVENKNGEYTYNGKPLTDGVTAAEIREVPVPEPLPPLGGEIASDAQLVEYIRACEDNIKKLIADNAALDNLLTYYINANKAYEQGIYQVALYPVIRHIISLHDDIAEEQAERVAEMTEETAVVVYSDALDMAITRCENILALCGVEIVREFSDKYDPKTQRVLKLIPTEDPALNEVVAQRYCDCYKMEDKVIYPSKVDVYKLK